MGVRGYGDTGQIGTHKRVHTVRGTTKLAASERQIRTRQKTAAKTNTNARTMRGRTASVGVAGYSCNNKFASISNQINCENKRNETKLVSGRVEAKNRNVAQISNFQYKFEFKFIGKLYYGPRNASGQKPIGQIIQKPTHRQPDGTEEREEGGW